MTREAFEALRATARRQKRVANMHKGAATAEANRKAVGTMNKRVATAGSRGKAVADVNKRAATGAGSTVKGKRGGTYVLTADGHKIYTNH